jgi:hypothetical protein
MLVLLDLRVDLVEGGVCGILTTRYLDVDQPLLVKVVTKNMGGIGKQLQVGMGMGRGGEREGKGGREKKKRSFYLKMTIICRYIFLRYIFCEY